ncbi:D-alanyl-D-alanine carboxypeptidase [Salibacterium salarium]|uniref:D-alanyl-D-alanine carboxypeptidase n=1 Tax=Salibacterium salarium TaxID=284579 RepID=A0A3R9WRY5_9BACI|nr:D-alanyl-D-alanine carboxypeptidase family protein [Salibacterium salarium]RSL32306.1 D-alanyl-D-alanine carboxypeptidase [Salibacterium salarium]
MINDVVCRSKWKYIILLFVCMTWLPTAAAGVDKDTSDMSLHSEAAVLIDAKTGQVLFEKNGEKQMYPASITKIATGIMAIEKANLNDKVTISENATEVEGTTVYLTEDEVMPLKQLVEGMLINSGNDAGTAIAEHISQSEQEFSKELTDYIMKKTGIEDTNFTNPHGLFSENHYSTAEDMAKITQFAMRNKDFRDIVSTKTKEWKGEEWETELRNHNQLLWDYEGANGVKNGYVTESGYTLVTSAKRDGRELIVVVLKADSNSYAYEDTTTLLNMGFDEFEERTLSEDDRYQSPNKTVYTLHDDRSFLTREGTNVDFEVNDKGKLNILDKEGNNIFSTYLSKERGKLGTETKKRTKTTPMDDNQETKKNTWKMWSEYSSVVSDTMYYHLQYMMNIKNL